jgi:crotonobetaine/carnitine-CoA ligase
VNITETPPTGQPAPDEPRQAVEIPGTEILNDWTLWTLLEQRAALGDKPMITVDADDVISYGELYERASRVAASLRREGVGHGQTIASLGYNATDQAVLMFACAALGAIWVPLNLSLLGDDLAYTLNDTGSTYLVIDAELLPKYDDVRDRVGIRHVFVRGDGEFDPSQFRAFADLLAPDAADFVPTPSEPDEAIAVIYTGGSTGMPKGVLASHTYFLAFGLRYHEIAQATPQDIHYTGALQIFHVGGQQFTIVGPMLCGMSAHISRWFSATRYWERARACGATIIDPNGPMMATIMKQPPSELDTRHKVRIGVGVGTGQVSPSVRDGFAERFGVPLMSVYAQTEVGGALFCSERLDERRLGSSGKPGRWGEMAVVDERDRQVPAGTVGELVARPAFPNSFMIGFLNKPEQAARAWRNLWHHTGDLGYIDEDGFVFFIGRQAHWLRRRGENISSYEVEQCIERVPGVADVAVVGVPDLELGEEEVKAFVVVEDGAVVTGQDVHAHCSQNLAYFKVPRYVEFVDSLPRSSVKNEIERHKLKERPLGDCWDARTSDGSATP